MTKNITIIVEAAKVAIPPPCQAPSPGDCHPSHTREAIDSRGNTAFVGQVAGDAAFVLGSCSANEGGVENKSIFWCVTPCLQGSGRTFSGELKISIHNPLPAMAAPPASSPPTWPPECPSSRAEAWPTQLPEAEGGHLTALTWMDTWSLCWALGITQTPGPAITPTAEACRGQGALVGHHRDSLISTGTRSGT